LAMERKLFQWGNTDCSRTGLRLWSCSRPVSWKGEADHLSNVRLLGAAMDSPSGHIVMILMSTTFHNGCQGPEGSLPFGQTSRNVQTAWRVSWSQSRRVGLRSNAFICYSDSVYQPGLLAITRLGTGSPFDVLRLGKGTHAPISN
jgi:hypothetical protein